MEGTLAAVRRAAPGSFKNNLTSARESGTVPAMVAPSGWIRVAVTVACAACLAWVPPVRAAYQALEEIPVESPVYGWIDAVAATWGMGSAFHATRPWDRADLGRFLDELGAREPGAGADPLVERLRRELAPGPHPGGWSPAVDIEEPASALEVSPYLRADFSEDRSRHAVARDFRGGLLASAALGEHGVLSSDVYAGTESPGPHGNPVRSERFGLVEGVRVNSYLDRATVAGRWPMLRVRAGQSWLRWGPGRWGTMALSDGAPALDLVEARVPLLTHLQFESFVASLDPTEDTWLAGHRIELRPVASLDLSFAELARFDGTANVFPYAASVIPYSLIEKRVQTRAGRAVDESDSLFKNNVMWSADLAWRWRPGWRAYGELAIDDLSFSSVQRPRALAWQLGAQARCRAGSDAWMAQAEYARVYLYTYSVFHHHDFAYDGFPTAFFLGPDVERLGARIEWRHGPEWAFAVEGSATHKGEGRLGEYWTAGQPADQLGLSGVVERDTRAAFSADWSASPALSLGAMGGYAKARDLAHVRGADATGAYGSTRATLRW